MSRSQADQLRVTGRGAHLSADPRYDRVARKRTWLLVFN